MSNGEWYYAIDGKQHGPVPLSALQQLAASGALRPHDLVWNAGMSNWQAAGTVEGLYQTTPPQGSAYPAGGHGYATAGNVPLGYYAPAYAGPQYAGFWIRFCAALLDGLILILPNLIISFGMRAAFGLDIWDEGSGPAGTEALADISASGLHILVAWLYSALQESSGYQATLGKRACGIMVTDLGGQRISFGRATGRHFAKIISYITLMIGFMMAGWTQRKQALHDMIAGTYVMYGRR